MKTDKRVEQRSTVVGMFHGRDDAIRAMTDLKSAGFAAGEISLVGKNSDGEVVRDEHKEAVGAASGAAVGASAAALASLGMSFGVIPVIGPILAVGPLAAALISAVGGAATAGVAGGLIGLGLEEEEAKFYEDAVRAGDFLVAVNAGKRFNEAWNVLRRTGAYNHETAAVVVTQR